jgi:hypothetical protein
MSLQPPDIDALDRERNSALHYAARHSLKDLVLELMALGADLSIVGGEGQTAADEAAESGDGELASLLEARVVYGGEQGEGEPSGKNEVEVDAAKVAETFAGVNGLTLGIGEQEEMLGVHFVGMDSNAIRATRSVATSDL